MSLQLAGLVPPLHLDAFAEGCASLFAPLCLRPLSALRLTTPQCSAQVRGPSCTETGVFLSRRTSRQGTMRRGSTIFGTRELRHPPGVQRKEERSLLTTYWSESTC